MSNKYIEQLVKMAEESKGDGIGSTVVKGLATGAGIGAGAIGAAALGKKFKAFKRKGRMDANKSARASSSPKIVTEQSRLPAPKQELLALPAPKAS